MIEIFTFKERKVLNELFQTKKNLSTPFCFKSNVKWVIPKWFKKRKGGTKTGSKMVAYVEDFLKIQISDSNRWVASILGACIREGQAKNMVNGNYIESPTHTRTPQTLWIYLAELSGPSTPWKQDETGMWWGVLWAKRRACHRWMKAYSLLPAFYVSQDCKIALVSFTFSKVNVCMCEFACVTASVRECARVRARILPLGLNCMQDMGLSWAGKWATTPSPSESSLTKTCSLYTDTPQDHHQECTHINTKKVQLRLNNENIEPEWDFPRSSRIFLPTLVWV